MSPKRLKKKLKNRVLENPGKQYRGFLFYVASIIPLDINSLIYFTKFSNL